MLAGQSFGGYVTLEAIDTSPDIDAAGAFAPGVRAYGAAGRLDASVVDRILQRAAGGRLTVVFPKHDATFGNVERGESAATLLSHRSIPHLLLDETSEVAGHGGALTGRFALRYGACLVDFLSDATPRAGRFVCPPVVDEWPVVRDLLLSSPAEGVVRAPDTLPAAVGALAGLRWSRSMSAPLLDGRDDP